MLSWASSQFEKLAQTVAPPPTDPASRFVYCCQRGEEDEAMQLASQLPGSGVIVNQSKQQVPLHVSCSYGMIKLSRYLLNQPGASLDMLDGTGNTLLHCAASCAQPVGLDLVKVLVNEMGANVCAKNFQGQTPYDVATLNNVRQFLLPIQLQQETKEALANGGHGLPPGIDMGGLKIQNAPPPPIPGGTVGPPPQGLAHPSEPPLPASPYPQPPNPFAPSASAPSTTVSPSYPQQQAQFPVPTSGNAATPLEKTAIPAQPHPPSAVANSAIPRNANPHSVGQETPAIPVQSSVATPTPAPSSGDKADYALSGFSSAAIYKAAPGSGGIRPDGFHSSSSDKRLQQKYGHSQGQQYSHIPPPPSSGSSAGALSRGGSVGNSASAPPSGGPNPYAAGMASRQRPNRYVNYNPVTGQAAPTYVRPASSYGAPSTTAAPANAQYNVFRPGANSVQPAPVSADMASPLPPPPFQLQPREQQTQPVATTPSNAVYTPQVRQVSPASYPYATGGASVTSPAQASLPVQPFPRSQPVASPSSGTMMTSSTMESASAVFSSPPVEAATTITKATTASGGDATGQSGYAVPLPEQGASTAPVDPTAVFSSPPVGTQPSGGATPPAAPAVDSPAGSFPDQVSFSNREVSGVSVLSGPTGESGSTVPTDRSPSNDEGGPESNLTDRRFTPQADVPEGEDFDDVPLSPAPLPDLKKQATSNPAMPPPPFSSS